MYQINMLYNLNFYNVIYQIYFYLKKIKNFSSTKDSIKSKDKPWTGRRYL